MKVLLINAPLEIYTPVASAGRAAAMPLGILYIAAVLEKAGIEVAAIDCVVNQEKLAVELKKKYELIGISATSLSFNSALALAKVIKEYFPAALLVLGGPHPAYFPAEILSAHSQIDIVVTGEGEYCMLELAQKLPLAQIKGIAYREGTEIRVNPNRPLLENLDEFPFPARHLLPAEKYGYWGSTLIADPLKYASIVVSRGCPFRCRFCCVTAYNQGNYRIRSLENVLGEIEELKAKGVERIFVYDSNFTADKKWALEFCERIKKFKLRWYCLGSTNTASAELFKAMAQTGCRLIFYGIESCSQKILDYYSKKTSVAQIKSAVSLAQKFGMDVYAGLIVGAPVETFEDIKETVRNIRQMDIDLLEVSRLALYPGTSLWNEAKEKDLIQGSMYEGSPGAYFAYGQPAVEEVNRWIKYILDSFYKRPRQILKEIWRILVRRQDILWLNLSKGGGIRALILPFGGHYVAKWLGVPKRKVEGQLD